MAMVLNVSPNKFVFISTYAAGERVKHLYKITISGYLVKSVSINLILETGLAMADIEHCNTAFSVRGNIDIMGHNELACKPNQLFNYNCTHNPLVLFVSRK